MKRIDKYLKYENFLTNKKSYLSCEKLWKESIESILPKNKHHEEWIINQYINETIDMDGNPIYSVWIPELKYALRIIQIERNLNAQIFNIWINDTEYENEPVKELVISVQLYRETIKETTKIVKTFFSSKLTQEKIDSLHKKYEKKWEQEKVSYVIKYIKKDVGIIMFKRLKNYELNQIDPKNFKEYSINIEDDILGNIYFINDSLENRFSKLHNSLNNLNNVLTVKCQWDFEKMSNYPKNKRTDDYAKEIFRQYGNSHNYFISLLSKVNKIEEETEEFKELMKSIIQK